MSCERPNVLTTIKLHNSLGLDYFKSISHSFLLPSGVRAVLLMTQGVRWACSKEVIHPGTPGCHQVLTPVLHGSTLSHFKSSCLLSLYKF